jgi:hypothetical protein
MSSSRVRLAKLERDLGHGGAAMSEIWEIGDWRIDFSLAAPPQTIVIGGKAVTF